MGIPDGPSLSPGLAECPQTQPLSFISTAILSKASSISWLDQDTALLTGLPCLLLTVPSWQQPEPSFKDVDLVLAACYQLLNGFLLQLEQDVDFLPRPTRPCIIHPLPNFPPSSLPTAPFCSFYTDVLAPGSSKNTGGPVIRVFHLQISLPNMFFPWLLPGPFLSVLQHSR